MSDKGIVANNGKIRILLFATIILALCNLMIVGAAVYIYTQRDIVQRAVGDMLVREITDAIASSTIFSEDSVYQLDLMEDIDI